MLIKVGGRLVQPFGRGNKPFGGAGTIEFQSRQPGVFAGALKHAGSIVTPIEDGVIAPVELVPGIWNVRVMPSTGACWRYTIEVKEPSGYSGDGIVDIAEITPITEIDGKEYLRGMSAFEVAVAEGFSGSRRQWLESLNRLYEGVEIRPFAAGVLQVDGGAVFNDRAGVLEFAAPFTSDPLAAWSVNPHAQRQNRWIDNLSYDEVTNAIYSGYGDWSANGDAVYIVKHDLDTGEAYTVSHRIKSEAVGQVMRHGDWLYAPHVDWSGNYWAGGGYATNEGGFWHDVRLPGQCEHLFFMLSTPDGLWAAGSSIHPNQADVGPTLWFRPNSGHVDSREEYPEGVATPAVGEGWQIIYRSSTSGDNYYRFYRIALTDDRVWAREDIGEGVKFLGFASDGSSHVIETDDPTGGALKGRGTHAVVVDGNRYTGSEYGKILKEKVVG